MWFNLIFFLINAKEVCYSEKYEKKSRISWLALNYKTMVSSELFLTEGYRRNSVMVLLTRQI